MDRIEKMDKYIISLYQTFVDFLELKVIHLAKLIMIMEIFAIFTKWNLMHDYPIYLAAINMLFGVYWFYSVERQKIISITFVGFTFRSISIVVLLLNILDWKNKTLLCADCIQDMFFTSYFYALACKDPPPRKKVTKSSFEIYMNLG